MSVSNGADDKMFEFTINGEDTLTLEQYYHIAEELYGNVENGSVQLIWTDPPFGTDKVQQGSKHSYRDGSVDDTLAHMKRLGEASLEMLTPSGVLAVCLDYRAVHPAHSVLSDVGLIPQGEIIWHFELGGISKRWWTNKHNTILLFSKTDEPQFNAEGIPRVPRKAPKPGYETPTKAVASVWTKTLGNLDPERVGRANQKPLALVEPFVEVHTEPGDLVVAPLMGSGTTGVAARKLGRRFAGADTDLEAINITFERINGR